MKTIFIGIMLTMFLISGPVLGTEIEPPEGKVLKPALLVIDIQNQYLPMMSDSDRDRAMKRINYAIWIFRQHNLPVIRVYHTDPEYGPAPDSEEFEFPESVIIKEEDPKIIKNHGNGFVKTDLEKVIRENGCNTLFMCGLSATGCVLATFQGARDHDFETFLIKDALLSHDAEYTNSIEEIFDAVSLSTVNFMLEHIVK